MENLSAIFDNLKKGDKVQVAFDNSIKKNNQADLVVKNRTVVGVGKPWEAEKITFINTKNPSGVKYFGYRRKGSGKVSFAIGDMATSNVSVIKQMATGGRTSQTTSGKPRYTVHIYYGGEKQDETVYTNNLSEAKRLAMRGEHGEIIDNQSNKLLEMAKGGTLLEISKDAKNLSKNYGVIYVIKRGNGEYVNASYDDLSEELEYGKGVIVEKWIFGKKAADKFPGMARGGIISPISYSIGGL
jgi:hypothetical protein